MENTERSRSRIIMDYSQVGLPRLLDQNEISVRLFACINFGIKTTKSASVRITSNIVAF